MEEEIVLLPPNEIDYKILNLIESNNIDYAYSLVKKYNNNNIFMFICKFLLGRIKYKEYSCLDITKLIDENNSKFILSNIDKDIVNENILCIINWICRKDEDTKTLLNHPVGYFRYASIYRSMNQFNYNEIKFFGSRAIIFWMDKNYLKYPTENFHLLHYIKKYTNYSDLYKWLGTFYYYGIGCNINKEKSDYYFSLGGKCTSKDENIIKCAQNINVEIGQMIYILNGTDKGRQAWYIVLVKPSEFYNFNITLGKNNIPLEYYGSVLFSAYGKKNINDPFVKTKLKNVYKHKHVLFRHIKNINKWSDTDLSKLIFEPISDSTFNCTICFENDDIINGWICYTCGTLFHKDCYKRWLEINPTCPMCRSQSTF